MQPVIVDNLHISKESSISWLFDMMTYFQHNFSLSYPTGKVVHSRAST